MNVVVLMMLTLMVHAQPSDDALLAARVLRLFEQNCAECHGDDMAKPKGDFGFVTDLVRLSGDEAYVVPGDPDRSDIYLQMEWGEMPPPKSKFGKATVEQIELVKQWVLAGAPAPTAEAIAAIEPPQAEKNTDPLPPAQSFGDRLLSWLGRLHPATVHFPIAFLIGAALFELWMMVGGKRELAFTVRYCVWIGASGAIGAAALGWLHADYAGFANETVMQHRVVGIVVAVWGVVSVWAVERQHRRDNGSRALVRWTVLIGAILVAIAGHLGGAITYGPHHYDW